MKTLFTLAGLLASCLLFAQTETGKILIISPTNCIITIDGANKHNLFANKPLTLELSAGDHLVQDDCSGELGEYDQITIETGKQTVYQVKTEAPAAATTGERKEITVIDATITIPGILTADGSDLNTMKYESSGRPIFVYYFGAGDEIKMNLTRINKKGTQWMTIKSYPDDNLIYSNQEIQHLKDFSLKIETSGIYVITVGTHHAFDRSAKFSLVREVVTGEEVKDSRVGWAISYHLDPVVKSHSFWVNSTTNSGPSTVSVAVNLPPNTVSWYYVVAASRDKASIEASAKKSDLYKDLATAAVSGYATLISGAMDLISAPPGTDYVSALLIDHANYPKWKAGMDYNHYPEGERANIRSGEIHVKGARSAPLYYVLVTNSDLFNGVEVAFEAVAIVQDQELMSVSDIIDP